LSRTRHTSTNAIQISQSIAKKVASTTGGQVDEERHHKERDDREGEGHRRPRGLPFEPIECFLRPGHPRASFVPPGGQRQLIQRRSISLDRRPAVRRGSMVASEPKPKRGRRRFGIGPVSGGPTSPRNEMAFGARFG
jgi:hypothetical protein